MAAHSGSEPNSDADDQLTSVIAELVSIIATHWGDCGRAEQYSLDRNPIRELFLDDEESEKLLEDLFDAVESATRARMGRTMPRPKMNARRFRKRVIGDTLALSRSKILATILQAGEDFLLRIWDLFLEHLEGQTFIDPRLPDCKLEELELLMGSEEDALAFSSHQHNFYEVDTTGHFNEVRQKLKSFLNQTSDEQSAENLVVCQRLGLEGEPEGERTEDRWYPDLVPTRVIENHAELVQSLFVEAYKTVHRLEYESDPREKRRILSEAKLHAMSMYQAVWPRAKVLAILICINVTANTSMWRNFVRICLEDSSVNREPNQRAEGNLVLSRASSVSETASFLIRTQGSLLLHRRETKVRACLLLQIPISKPHANASVLAVGTLHDSMLPMEEESIRNHLGADDSQLFFSTQYSFCTVFLRKEQQTEWEHSQLHLPLLSRRPIGSGSFGDVFHVTVKAGYFEGYAGDQDVAMKVMERKTTNYAEWDSAKWLFLQPVHHEGIMRAISSVKTRSQILIFFPLAHCSLSRFMSGPRKDVTYHPRTSASRQKALGWFVDLAEALKYLHCGMQEPSRKAKMVLIHEDLKTDNILVLLEAGDIRFQITDFGISSVKRFQRSENAWETVNRNALFRSQRSLRDLPTKPGVKDNCSNFPPEARDGGEVDASIDIWAFGLVLAEGLAWIAGGPELLKSFKNVRYDESRYLYHEIDPDTGKPRLKQSVRLWFEALLEEPREPNDHKLLRDTWDLLQHGLLACVPKERPRTEDVCEILGRIYRREQIDVREALSRAQSRRTVVIPEPKDDPDLPHVKTGAVLPSGSPKAAAPLRPSSKSPSSQNGRRALSESNPLPVLDRSKSLEPDRSMSVPLRRPATHVCVLI